MIMVGITISEFIYLLPILILGLASLILMFLLLVLHVKTKTSAIFAIASLSLALVSSAVIGYQVISSSDTQQIASYNQSVTTATETALPNGSQTESTLAVADSTAVAESSAIAESGINKDESSFWHATYVTALFTSDGYGALYTCLVLLLCIVVSTLACKWFDDDNQINHGLFYLMVLFSALGSTILVYASHLISLFIGIELLSIPLVGLIGYQYTQHYALEAAIKYMVLSAVATAFLLLGIAFYYAATGELTFSGLSFQLSTQSAPSTLLLLGVCLILVGVGFKLSLVPFQLWLPDVFQGAPACIALLLTTASKTAIFSAVARLFLLAPIVNNETIRIIMVIMAFCSIIWGNVIAIKQHNIKRLLAYSSITHFGYLLIALIAVQYQVLALETIGIYLIGYVLANICVLGVISLESHANKKEDLDYDIDIQGLFWRRPIIALAMGVGLLSLAGMPFTIGFIGRFSLVLLSVTAELWWLVGAIIVGSVLGLYFYLRLTINLYIKPSEQQKNHHPRVNRGFKLMDINVNEIFIVSSALLILLCGVYPRWIFNLVSVAKYLMPD